MSEIGLSRDTSLLEIPAPPALVGRTLAQAAVRHTWGVTVVAVRRGAGSNGQVVVSPAPDVVIEVGDIVVLAGRNEDLERLRAAEGKGWQR